MLIISQVLSSSPCTNTFCNMCLDILHQDAIAEETNVIVENQAADEQLLKDLEDPDKIAQAIGDRELNEEDAIANGGIVP